MVRLTFFLSFARVANSRPCNSRNFAAQILSTERETARSLRESAKKEASASTMTAENEFAYFQTLSRLFNLLRTSNAEEFPLEFISWGPHLS